MAAFALTGCHYHFENPHLGPRGLTEEDLLAPPNKTEVRSRITYDIRHNQAFRDRLGDGMTALPRGLEWDELRINLKRTSDGKLLWKFTLWADPAEKHAAVTETVYWDEEGQVYFYRYEGGDPVREAWFGPIAVRFHRPTLPNDGHGH